MIDSDKSNHTKIKWLDAATSAADNASAGATTHDTDQVWYDRQQFLQHSIHIINAGGATVKVYGSHDAANWVEVYSTTATGVLTQLAGIYSYLKILRDAATAGTVTSYICSGDAA